MANSDMKQTIVDEFKRMVRESSLSKVRIAELIDNLHINRNTFYYYFGSKLDVAFWIFRWDLSHTLEQHMPSSRLVYSDCKLKEGGIERLAYWTHVETGAHKLDSRDFCCALMRCVGSDRAFYSKLFNVREYEFLDWTVNLWSAAITHDIDFILDGRRMDAMAREFLTITYSRHITNLAMTCLNSPALSDLLDQPEEFSFWGIVGSSVRNAINENPSGMGQNPIYGIYAPPPAEISPIPAPLNARSNRAYRRF